MKNLLIAFILFMCINQNALGKDIPITFKINGEKITGEKFYLIVNGKESLVPIVDDKIHVPDTIKYPFTLILIYKKYQVLFSVPYSDAEYLQIYYDTRKDQDELDRISGGDWTNPKYNSKRKYLIDYGNGMIGITVASGINYFKKYGIPTLASKRKAR
jgi:hypothetical protein